MRGEMKAMARGGERGTATFIMVMVLAIAALIPLMLVTVRQQSMAGHDFHASAVAYYAAEGGLEKAIAAAESGAAGGTFSGRLGDGLYESSVEMKGGKCRIISRGYWAPRTRGAVQEVLKKLRRAAGFHKNKIVVQGRVAGGRFRVESWTKYP